MPLNPIIYCAAFCVLLAIAPGCSNPDPMTGRYKGVKESTPGMYSFVELKSEGRGIWETEIDFVKFRWEVQEDLIWLRTDTGKVILGSLTPDGFNLELPSLGILVFTRQSF